MLLELFLIKISNVQTKRYFLEKLRTNIRNFEDRYRLVYINGDISLEKIDKFEIS
jgi:hypothetical protein